MSGQHLTIGLVETSLGTFGALISPKGLARLTFPREGVDLCRAWAARWWPGAPVDVDSSLPESIGDQLQAYLAGQLRDLDLALDMQGTQFQRQVWQALTHIPYGQTLSYATLAAELGRPRAVRAVGRANGANPVPIVVPCHRVIGSGGTLVGYGGGLELKKQLLALEGCSSWR